MSGLTLKALEDAFLRHFLGLSRDEAVEQSVYQFCVLKTLRGPRLSMDSPSRASNFASTGMLGLKWYENVFETYFHPRLIHTFFYKPSVIPDGSLSK